MGLYHYHHILHNNHKAIIRPTPSMDPQYTIRTTMTTMRKYLVFTDRDLSDAPEVAVAGAIGQHDSASGPQSRILMLEPVIHPDALAQNGLGINEMFDRLMQTDQDWHVYCTTGYDHELCSHVLMFIYHYLRYGGHVCICSLETPPFTPESPVSNIDISDEQSLRVPE